MTAHDEPVRSLLDELRREGVDVREGASPGSYRVSSSTDRQFAHDPVLTLPEDLYAEYVRALIGGAGARSAEDAQFLARMHVVESLTTDHGAGCNRVRSLALRRRRSGVVEMVVDVEASDPSDAPDSGLTWSAER